MKEKTFRRLMISLYVAFGIVDVCILLICSSFDITKELEANMLIIIGYTLILLWSLDRIHEMKNSPTMHKIYKVILLSYMPLGVLRGILSWLGVSEYMLGSIECIIIVDLLFFVVMCCDMISEAIAEYKKERNDNYGKE